MSSLVTLPQPWERVKHYLRDLPIGSTLIYVGRVHTLLGRYDYKAELQRPDGTAFMIDMDEAAVWDLIPLPPDNENMDGAGI